MQNSLQGVDLPTAPPRTPDSDLAPLAKSIKETTIPISTLSPQQLSTYCKSNLSNYLSPMAMISKSMLERDMPDYSVAPAHSTPHIKFVPYGTGTGKSYGAMRQYLKFQSMDYSDIPTAQILHRDQSRHNFTNAVFVTPNKNQISFNANLVADMLSKGITPLSALSLADMYTHSTKLWIDGKHTIEARLKDYLSVILIVEKLHLKIARSGWQHHHIRTLKVMIRNLGWAVKVIKDLDVKRSTGNIVKEEYDKEMLIATKAHNSCVQQLVMCLLNNTYNKNHALSAGLLKTINEPDSDDTFSVSESDYYITQAAENDTDEQEDVGGDAGMMPIKTGDVFDDIFAIAKPKPHFDMLIGDILDKSVDSFECMLATLKKDILRVYAPLNYATYLPSFICMTSNKFRMRVGLYRKSKAKGQKTSSWTYAADYSNYAELIGNKISFKGAMTSVPSTNPDAKNEQLDQLNRTLMLARTDNRESGDFDDRSPFAQKNIDFYVIVDEANGLFEQDFVGDSFRDGVIKPIMKDFSVTDILSCVERKYREFCHQPKENIDCFEQNEYFFACMYAYLDRYCDIDPEKVMSMKSGASGSEGWLLQFDFPPNIIYIDNGESFSVTDIIKNAFSVTAKKFIAKEHLEAIFVCKRGQHRYLSTRRSSDSDITLYELYQIIIAILFAAIQLEDTENPKFTPEHRQAFRLDLAGGSANNEIKRQNEPFAALLTYARNHAKQYKEWLVSDHLNNNPQAIVDDWFTYIQTKLLFTLNRNKTFDSSPDIGHGLKVFFDIKLHLITHHPEIDILRMVVGTKNHLHLMSATSGKTKAYSGQYNIKFIQKWGRDLGVKVNLPEYDHFHKTDYRDDFQEFRDHRASMRTIDVITYEDANDASRLLAQPEIAPASASSSSSRLSRSVGRIAPMSPKRLKSSLHAIHQEQSSYPSFIPAGSYNDKALDNALSGLFLGLQKLDSTLLISYRSDLFKFLFDSMKAEFTYKHANKDTLNNAIRDKQSSVTFAHAIFGDFQLPLLNEYLFENQSTLKLSDISRIEKDVSTKYIYMVDFLNLEGEGFKVPAEKIARLALYDSSIDKMVTHYRQRFVAKTVTHKGVERQLFTTIVSYNKAAALGLNNVIDNQMTNLTEDVNRLFLSSLAYWTDINSKSDDGDDDGMEGFGKVENSLVYMRYCADNSKIHPLFISEFDANLTGYESAALLRHEHSLHKSNNFKQTLGRTEREDSRSDFVSEIVLPIADLKEQTKVNYLSYKIDQNGNPKQDKTDFAFMSLNNHTVLQHGIKMITATATTDEGRSLLEDDTKRQNEHIKRFVAFDGFIGKVLRAARSGDNEEHRELADAAIKFDLAYREPSILCSPEIWCKTLISILHENPILTSKLGFSLDSVLASLRCAYINPTMYENGENLDFYPLTANGSTIGLTDFFGQHNGTTEPYCPSKFVLKYIDPQKLSSADTTFSSLIETNNKFTKPDSSRYNHLSENRLILHPAMQHMALGNIGEKVFEEFLLLYAGNYARYSANDITEKFGYRFYEFFDFWLKCNTTKSWVCVDVKNHSHKENIKQTARLQDGADRKISAIQDNALTAEQTDMNLAVEQVQAMGDFFEDTNEIHIVFVNVREGEYSTTRHIQKKVMVAGREIVMNIHYLCLFQKGLYLDEKDRKLLVTERNQYNEKKKPKSRHLHLTVHPKLLELLDIEIPKGVTQSLQEIHPQDGEHDHDMTAAVASIFTDVFNVDFPTNHSNSESDTNQRGE